MSNIFHSLSNPTLIIFLCIYIYIYIYKQKLFLNIYVCALVFICT